jgi:citrate lyase beta subunit
MSARRCVLFVPGNRPERFDKAVASGADMVCIDLEDATPIEAKKTARASALSFIASYRGACELILRVNPISTDFGQDDLHAIAALDRTPALVMLPKVESETEMRDASKMLVASQTQWIALLESAMGIENAFRIASTAGLCALMFGGADYTAQLGAQMSESSMLYARSRLAAAAASQQLFAIDVPHLDIQNTATLRAEIEHVKALGFSCKSAIHPLQVSLIQEHLRPTQAEIEHSQGLLEAFYSAPLAAIAYQGKLIDRPVVLAAEAILKRAGLNTKN